MQSELLITHEHQTLTKKRQAEKKGKGDQELEVKRGKEILKKKEKSLHSGLY